MITTWESPVPRADSRRIGFLYIEESRLSQRDGAFLVQDESGSYELPVASIATLMIGPGVTVTSKAIHLASSMNVSVIWTGQNGVRFYASGGSGTYNAKFIQTQAKLVSNVHLRAQVARKMYMMRFNGEDDLSQYTIAQLRGKEGSRVKEIYQRCSKEFNVPWNRRQAQLDGTNDTINTAITMATQCLYGLTHSVIESIGASPALGFIHTGHSKSFVFDIADLYKMDMVLPIAFSLASSSKIELEARTRMRETMFQEKLAQRIIKDIKILFSLDDEALENNDQVYLWDDVAGEVPANISWKEE